MRGIGIGSVLWGVLARSPDKIWWPEGAGPSGHLQHVTRSPTEASGVRQGTPRSGPVDSPYGIPLASPSDSNPAEPRRASVVLVESAGLITTKARLATRVVAKGMSRKRGEPHDLRG